MEEKKLTVEMEDILIEFDEYGFAPTITMPNAEEYAKAWKNSLLDLFQRLCFREAEQKTEIERLTKKLDDTISMNEMYVETVRQNAELQKQVDELKAGLNRVKDEHDKMASLAQSLEEKNTDLRLNALDLMNEISEHKNDYARLNEAYVNLNNLYQQAVKDTAKEILQEVANEYTENVGYTDWLDDCYWGDVQIRLCKKYGLKAIQTKKGVEVE